MLESCELTIKDLAHLLHLRHVKSCLVPKSINLFLLKSILLTSVKQWFLTDKSSWNTPLLESKSASTPRSRNSRSKGEPTYRKNQNSLACWQFFNRIPSNRSGSKQRILLLLTYYILILFCVNVTLFSGKHENYEKATLDFCIIIIHRITQHW